MTNVGRGAASRWPAPKRQTERHKPNGAKHQSTSRFRKRVESIPLSSSTTVTGPVPLPPPRLRSRGGWGVGSSDRSARTNPRPSGLRTDRTHPRPPPAGFVEAARLELRRQRSFRINQLNQLDTSRTDALTDPARSQVHQALRAAARSVLADIDAALRRIEHGSYGRCHECGDAMSLNRLTALPMAAWCGSCQRVRETLNPPPGSA